MRLGRLGEAEGDALFAGVDDAYPFYHNREYAEHCTAHERTEFYLARSRAGGLVPVRLQRKAFGLRVAKIVYPPVVDGHRLDAAGEAQVLDELVAHLRRTGFCHRLAPTPAHVAFNAYPEGAVACPWSTYAVDLQAGSEQDLLAAMSRTYRRQIRMAVRAGASVATGEDQLEVVYALVAETLRRAGARVPARAELESLYRHAGERRAICASLVLGGAVLAGIFCVFTRHALHYLWGGSVRGQGPPGSNKLLHWDLMRRFKASGVARYDFGGVWLSDPPGLGQFKLRWGAQVESGFMWKLDLDPVRCQLFDRMAAARGLIRGRRIRPDPVTLEREQARAGATRPVR